MTAPPRSGSGHRAVAGQVDDQGRSVGFRNSIKVRKACDEVEAEPGFFEVDTVAHCGPPLKGGLTRTVNMTAVLTGWTFSHALPFRKNDQAIIESKNNHLVRRNAFYYRYDISEEREAGVRGVSRTGGVFLPVSR